MENFLSGRLGKLPAPVHRLGLSAFYRPGKETIHRAVDAGLNTFFFFGFDTHMTGALRDILQRGRERFVVVTGAYNFIWWRQDLRRTLEKRLRQLGTEYVDVFLFLGVMKPEQCPGELLDRLRSLRDGGRVKAAGISVHDRKFAGELASAGALDVLMVRYNAAHRGAETDVFPHLERHDTGLISYTATRWRALLRRPKGWPENGRVPDAGLCYRFVLSQPAVDVCLTAPSSLRQFEDNLKAAEKGPLDEDEMRFMTRFGDAVYRERKYFM